jgi:hypothetical protein
MLAVFEAIVFVLAVILFVAEVILVPNKFSALVALVISAVILAVFDIILVSKVDIVDEFTPPILFTVGNVAVPPKSLVNCMIPFELVVASGAVELIILAATNAVVAI